MSDPLTPADLDQLDALHALAMRLAGDPSTCADAVLKLGDAYPRLAATLRAAWAENERLRDEVQQEKDRAEFCRQEVEGMEKGFHPKIALLELEVERLKAALRQLLEVGVPSGHDLALVYQHSVEEGHTCAKCERVQQKQAAVKAAKEALGD